ncbi:CPBP family intramembrane glutamic endopeptidase [Nocardiopsis changdeensis]|uniref:CPBP family intramembrane metalloprotease n=1 Tax=Nocardiopsis changdeensis TaxID=2831969 RepID=A0ABX8BUH3_9ACTN|nr:MULTISPECIES: CPBP family intramembrane glutamic endopeptidase [Nocardiopsis]QUX25533.1 CPBP family intramembrane metalloprotease [Nocardiopsis changdeensis]QYX35919.1 CPBP family intramembrane metalloprotease [Nocardiopsis sp. MT53]
MTAAAPPGGRRTSRHDLRSVAVFTGLAFALAWLFALPLWLGEGIADPWFAPVAVAVMGTPAIAALVVVFFVERPPHKARTLGLWPLRPARRVLGYAAAGILVPIALVLAALPVGALLGVYPADFTGFSAFREVLDEQAGALGADGIPVPVGVLVAVQVAALPMAAFINLLPALGEELGWRGWLLPKLMPLGTLPALLVSGVIWGVWHAPLVLLGYNYPDAPGWLAVVMMTGMCTVVGAVFGWLRLRSGSVWPAALAHAAFNGAGGTYLLFAAAGEHIDTTQATVLGWSGWIVPLAFVAVLVATGRFAPAPPPPPAPSGRDAPLEDAGPERAAGG